MGPKEKLQSAVRPDRLYGPYLNDHANWSLAATTTFNLRRATAHGRTRAGRVPGVLETGGPHRAI